jgi:signal transduction histidine kinase
MRKFESCRPSQPVQALWGMSVVARIVATFPKYREAHMELTHATRVATLGQLSASIAHELRQPLAAIVTNGNASLRWLTRQPPEIDEAGLAVGGIIEDANRASEIIGRVHSLVTKNPVRKDLLDINEANLEVTARTHSEAIKHGVTVRTESSRKHLHTGEFCPIILVARKTSRGVNRCLSNSECGESGSQMQRFESRRQG